MSAPHPAKKQLSFKGVVLNGPFFLTLFFAAIGLAVAGVVGSIIVNAVHNDGLIPPPNTLARYECSAAAGAFSFYYLHGTDRVKIKSPQGIMEGTVHQNQLDWSTFANDASILGFLPPTGIAFENAGTLRLKGSDAQEISCTLTAKTAKPQPPAVP